ncbi:MAG: phosphoanhydride phosphohydrolase [Caulobacteraceae bacterium]|nr:phosphoanhydride phosphohydrolase [Caulobacteraceae bacterium]
MAMRLLTLLAVAIGLAGPAAAAPAPALKLERVVMLMRHGIRPPTSANVTPAGIADQAWPSWTTPYGELTAHGAEAVQILGQADRAALAGRGLLPARGCPAAGAVVLYADSDQRTIATGEALVRGLAPGCTLEFGHRPQDDLDPLFSPLDEPGPLDPAKAVAAARAQGGDLSSLAISREGDLRLAQQVLAPSCQTSVCNLSGMSSDISMPQGEGRPKATGPLDFLPTAAQTLMLEYVEGRPMSEVGWGRVTPV